MRRTVTIALLAALAGFGLAEWRPTPAHAQGGCTVPRNWGSLKATLGDVLVFEDADGTIRGVNEGCQTQVLVTRQ